MRNPFKRKTFRYPYGIPRVFGGREWTYFAVPTEVLDWSEKSLPNTTTVLTVTGGPVPPGSMVTVEFDPENGTSLRAGLEQFERGEGVSSDWLFANGREHG